MTEEILINVGPRETQVSIVENGALQEIYVERVSRRSIVGNIYLGRVVRVLPGMQAAFIDIGLNRAAFLHVSDMVSIAHRDEQDRLAGLDHQIQLYDNSAELPCISSLLKEGQNLAVQVTKEPLGTKGARLTTHLSLASRYLVFMPDMKYVGVSIRIEDETERERLKQMVLLGEDLSVGGYIVRTAAEGASQEDIDANKTYLKKLWQKVVKDKNKAQCGDLIHSDLPLELRALRDFVGDATEKIRIDSKEAYDNAILFAREFIPQVVQGIHLYVGQRPLFDLYNIADEIQKALHRKVSLKSGGHLVIDQTEAMTTIDVNTGAFVGRRNLEETIFKTNLEAAQAIARQLRLRNLGGIIIIDFIDMIEEDHKTQVRRALEKALMPDHAKTVISEISLLGLVEMTRKRTRESLEHMLCETCSTCQGRGSVKTAETICYEIFRDILRQAQAYDANGYLVLASQEVVDKMLDEESSSVAEIEDQIGTSITFQVEALYTQEQFDVVLI